MPQTELPQLSVPDEDMSWRDYASCRADRHGVDPKTMVDRFFKHKKGATDDSYASERIMCVTCAVREECLQFALNNCIPYGMFGGMSYVQRKQINSGRGSREISVSQIVKDFKKLRKNNPVHEASKLLEISEDEVLRRMSEETKKK